MVFYEVRVSRRSSVNKYLHFTLWQEVMRYMHVRNGITMVLQPLAIRLSTYVLHIWGYSAALQTSTIHVVPHSFSYKYIYNPATNALRTLL